MKMAKEFLLCCSVAFLLVGCSNSSNSAVMTPEQKDKFVSQVTYYDDHDSSTIIEYLKDMKDYSEGKESESEFEMNITLSEKVFEAATKELSALNPPEDKAVIDYYDNTVTIANTALKMIQTNDQTLQTRKTEVWNDSHDSLVNLTDLIHKQTDLYANAVTATSKQ